MELALLAVLTVVSASAVLALLSRAGTAFLLPFTVAGMLSVLPGFFLYGVAGLLFPSSDTGRWAEIVFTWTINAPVEELAKYFCFALASILLKSIRSPEDGIVQGAATGLGFALVENFLYGLSGGWELLLLRIFVSLPGHVLFGAVWGGYHGFEVYQGRGKIERWSVPLLALVPAAFSHAAFNTLAIVQAPLLANLAVDAATLGFGAFLFFRLRGASLSRRTRPLKEWALAIPELEHALALNPASPTLRRRLAAYFLVGNQPHRALDLLEALPESPWTAFYRDAALRRLGATSGPLPPSSSLNPKLFLTLCGD